MFTEKRIGCLIYNEESGRMDIRFGLEEYYGGLHCGEGMEVMVDGKWIHTRIEMDINSKWYLVAGCRRIAFSWSGRVNAKVRGASCVFQ